MKKYLWREWTVHTRICITDNDLKGFSRLEFYTDGAFSYMKVIGSGDSKMKNATITIDGTVQTGNDIAFDKADAITGFLFLNYLIMNIIK